MKTEVMTDSQINTHRVAGEITHIFKYGDPEEVASLLAWIEVHCGYGQRARLEQWIAEGMPGA